MAGDRMTRMTVPELLMEVDGGRAVSNLLPLCLGGADNQAGAAS